MVKKYVYFYTESNNKLKNLLGGKGANLGEMKALKIPVPPTFTITTKACAYYIEYETWPKELEKQIFNNLKKIEKETKSVFGSSKNPLLLSVRSGAEISMPGMMDTVLNLGLNDEIVKALAKKVNNEKFAYDSYRRLIQMFGEVEMGVSSDLFKAELNLIKQKKNLKFDNQLTVDDLKNLINKYKLIIKKKTGKEFPENPIEQLKFSINSIFKSWNNKRAIEYRRLHNIEEYIGTAVNIQAMVFGNLNKHSGTGVCFSRNPSTGENKFYGEYLIDSQGEDVVAGIRTPEDISVLRKQMPSQYKQLFLISKKLEKYFKDMQDIEFTIQDKKLYILQTRSGNRSGKAFVKISMDLLKEKIITEKEAILNIEPNSLYHLFHKSLDLKDNNNLNILTRGLPVSPGAVVGKIVFSVDKVFEEAGKGNKVILVRTEITPKDIVGMYACQGLLVKKSGLTSHAAVIARGMGKAYVSECPDLQIFEDKKKLIINKKTFYEGDYLTIDGSTGNVFEGKMPIVETLFSKDFKKLMSLSDKYKKLSIRANSDNLKDLNIAISFGAEGIGLCRTEHMFFSKNRIKFIREMILSKRKEDREKAINKLLSIQKKDFISIFEFIKEKPVTIRLLDLPLHEFLPKQKKEIEDLAKNLKISFKEVKRNIEELHEINPMLGQRGCRLSISYPEITEMQTKAIIGAVIFVNKKYNLNIAPEIMVPFVSTTEELKLQREIMETTIEKILNKNNIKLKYKIGTMIEIPRATLISEKIAEYADFFSFGTNDLTQMCLGLSRDDVNKFLKDYISKNIFRDDPFKTIDVEGVGKLMQISIEKGLNKNKNLELGVCGEQGGDPKSIIYFHNLGLHYVSCSPYRVPIAKLAAAQAAILEKIKN